MPNLTDVTIRAAPIPARGQKTIWDGLKGFGCRISQGGSKTFVVMIGSGRRLTIGRYPTVTLSEARAEAKRILAEKQLGKLRPARVSFDQALAEYLDDCKGRLRPRSLKNYRDYLTAYFRYGRRSLADITTREIITSLKNHPPSQREHALRIGRTFFTWCVRHSLLDASPMANMPPVALGRPRTRVLTEDELRAVWATARTLATPFHAIVALLLLTGARRGELSRLEWSWIGSDAITFPAHVTKNGREHTVPLGPEARAILAKVPRVSNRYVFQASRQRSAHTSVINGWSKAKSEFDKECGVTGWVLHDTRRVVASGLQRLGFQQIVVEKLLNHLSGGVLSPIAQVYSHHAFMPEKTQAIRRWEAYLTSLA